MERVDRVTIRGKILIGKSQGKKRLTRTYHRWKSNIKITFWEKLWNSGLLNWLRVGSSCLLLLTL